ncbi:MAG: DUF4114 domain-containing protein [Spirulinaceae cyanobacterium RM2_2_10]|nr:DUF4114 domain-containing protein [Spirulinaceae cyanobacterium SM2_1_0]NJO20705.1 DUF4114 domain-containing protein [Spirulinaceae cyanobacterium RM2_2_10]
MDFGLVLPFASQTPPGLADPDTGLFPTGDFSTPVFGDIDGDGDLDAVVGQYSSKGLTLSPTDTAVYIFTNNAVLAGDPPDFTAPPTKLTVTAVQATYSAPSLVDIDGDGALELFVGVAKFDAPTTSEILLFDNDGAGAFTAAPPTDNPFNGLTFTARRQVAPTFVRRGDVAPDDDSNLYDAVVIVNDGTAGSQILYYENTGTTTAPVLTPATTNPFAAINAAGVADPSIAFINADNDLEGLLDVLLAESTGSESILSALQNTASQFPGPLSVDPATNIFTVGTDGGSNLKLQLSGESANQITQVRLSFLDGTNAVEETIDLFSVLPTVFRPNGFVPSLQTFILPAIEVGDRFVIELQTFDGQLISFGGSSLQVTQIGTGQFQLAFEEGDGGGFDDFIFSIQQTPEAPPLGVGNLQEENLEILDLSSLPGVQASFTVYREATFNNFVGFYRIDDVSGSIGGIAPGQAGYAQAAVESRIGGIELSVANQNVAQFSASLAGGALYAPFIIANADPLSFLTDNPDNFEGGLSNAYFVFAAANPDRVDHIRLLGDNIFGFEDLPGGGDFDYNDVILNANLTA